MKKNASLGLFMQKAPVTETSRAAEWSLLLPGAEDAMRSWMVGEFWRIHHQWLKVPAQHSAPITEWGRTPWRCGILHNSSGLQEEALLPAAPGRTISVHSSSAWNSTTELLPKRGTEVCFPLSGWWNASDIGPYRPYSKQTTFELPGLCRLWLWGHFINMLAVLENRLLLGWMGLINISGSSCWTVARGNAVHIGRQKTEFHYCPVLSVSINPHPALLEVTANFPICINEIWTTSTAEC